MTAFCMKCKLNIEIKDPNAIKLKNGRLATQGTCPKCGTIVFRIGLVYKNGAALGISHKHL